MKNKRKFDKYAKRRLGLLFIICTLIVIIICICKKDETKYEDYRFIIGEKYTELQDDIYIDNFDNIYLSKEDILKLYDSNIYYNQVENMLITTYNKHIAILKLDENIININGSQIESKCSLIELNEKIYLPFSEMGIIYDFEYSYNKESKTIIVDSISEEKKETTIIKKSAKVKEEPKLLSSKIEKLNKDEKVTVLEELENYYKIRTSKGNVGYINKKKVGEIQIVRDKMENSKIKELNFIEYNDITKDYSDIQIDKSVINAVILDLFNIKNSNIEEKIDLKSNKFTDYINWANENDILVLAKITCEDEIIDDFLSYEKRKSIIEQIYTKLISNGIKGVDVEFEKINDVNSYYRFIIELAPKLRESGIKTIVKYNSLLKKEKLNTIVDYIIE